MFRLRQPAITWCTVIALLLFASSCATNAAPTLEKTPTATGRVSATAQATPTVPVAPTPTITPTPRPLLPLQLSSDPYANSGGQYQTEVEPSAYSHGLTIVTTFQAGRFSNVGSANIGWATSADGGATWRNGFLSGTTRVVGGAYDRITDPSVTYDAAHATWMIATVAFLTPASGIVAPAVLVSTSTDGGFTWNAPTAIMNAGNNGGLDKDWIACDNTASSPFYGHCYAEWDDYNRNDLIQMSTSQNGGKSWSAPKTTADTATGLGAEILVQPDGHVVVTMINANQTTVKVFTSTNGGANWNATVTVASVTSYPQHVAYRDNILLSAAMDGAGQVYLVWVDCRFETNCYGNDLVITTSTDGVHWQTLERIPIAHVGSGTYYYVSGLGLDTTTAGSTAHLGLTYYYYAANCSSNCPLFVGFVASMDGGSTWQPKIQLAGPMDATWLPYGNNKVGDYIATTFAGGLAFPIFAMGHVPTAGHLNEAMYTMVGGLEM